MSEWRSPPVMSPEEEKQRRAIVAALGKGKSKNNPLSYYLGPLADTLNDAGRFAWEMSPGGDYQYAAEGFDKALAADSSLADRAAGLGEGVAGSLMFMVPGVSANALAKGAAERASAVPRAAAPARVTPPPSQGGVSRREVLGGVSAIAALAAGEKMLPRLLRGLGKAPNPKEAAEMVAQLLRNGRGHEITDELFSRADQLYLNEIYDLPLDLATRARRAVDQGFDIASPRVHHSRTPTSSLAPNNAADAARVNTPSPQIKHATPYVARPTPSFDPTAVRGVGARFDPRLSHLKHLGAAASGAAPLGAVLYDQYGLPTGADQRTLREYLGL